MNYSFLLSAIQSDQQKKTLVQVQMLHKKLFTTERMVIAENKLESFKEIVEYIFDDFRIGLIFAKSDPLLEGEIKITHASEYLKKKLLKKLIDAKICPQSSSFHNIYFIFNTFKTNIIQNTQFDQHFLLTMEIASNDDLPDQQTSSSDEIDTLVIKVDPDTI